jgi:hypothetical protein
MLARSLLWAAYEVEVRTNDEVVSLIPSDLGARIKTAYAGGGNVNPIEKIGLLVSQHMDQLDIVPVYHDGDSGEGGGGGQGGGAAAALAVAWDRTSQTMYAVKFFTYSKLWGICGTR